MVDLAIKMEGDEACAETIPDFEISLVKPSIFISRNQIKVRSEKRAQIACKMRVPKGRSV